MQQRADGRGGWKTAMAALAVLGMLGTGCDLFAPREPEPPMGEGGTYEQPSEPVRVVTNLQAAVAEMNAPNYRRAFADDFVFVPAQVEGDDPVLQGWSLESEVSYFNLLAAASQPGAGHELALQHPRFTFENERRFTYEADYVLRVFHRSTGAPSLVQGHLIWELAQGADGLWRLQRWTDRADGSRPSWSTLKAAFAR